MIDEVVYTVCMYKYVLYEFRRMNVCIVHVLVLYVCILHENILFVCLFMLYI